MLGAGLLPAGTAARAATRGYPNRPVTFIVPWGPGGGSDQMARAFDSSFSKALGVAVPVQDVPGATGTVGIEKIVTLAADGYTTGNLNSDTLLRVATGISPWKLPDVEGVCRLMNTPYGIFVNAKDSRFKTWQEFAAYAKAHPGVLKFSHPGLGSAADIIGHYLGTKGIKLTGVPFAKPELRYAALLGRHVDALFDPAGNARRYVTGGQFRLLLVYAEKRLPQVPHVPAASEFGIKGPFLPNWRGLIVRKGTSPAIVSRLEKACHTAYDSAAFQKFVGRYGFTYPDAWMGAAEFQKFLLAQYASMITDLKRFGLHHA